MIPGAIPGAIPGVIPWQAPAVLRGAALKHRIGRGKRRLYDHERPLLCRRARPDAKGFFKLELDRGQ
ncbi:hypothetical protein TSH64_31090 [Azospirillum sp. TSH64]|nr:hypothetical protein TSH64_31090 [Azospirillum sp. TSH64]